MKANGRFPPVFAAAAAAARGGRRESHRARLLASGLGCGAGER